MGRRIGVLRRATSLATGPLGAAGGRAPPGMAPCPVRAVGARARSASSSGCPGSAAPDRPATARASSCSDCCAKKSSCSSSVARSSSAAACGARRRGGARARAARRFGADGIERQRLLGDGRGGGVARRPSCPASVASSAAPPRACARAGLARRPTARAPPRWSGSQREDPAQVIDGPLDQAVLHEHVRLREDARATSPGAGVSPEAPGATSPSASGRSR